MNGGNVMLYGISRSNDWRQGEVERYGVFRPKPEPKVEKPVKPTKKKTMKLELREILWELTPKCNKNCKYCGSKEVMNKSEELGDIRPILRAIKAYPPQEVTLSGGEPAVSKHFADVVNQLFDAKIPVKVVSNGTVFRQPIDVQSKLAQIGFSVNMPEDIKAKGPTEWKGDRKRVTMITNFGTHNIWNFTELYDYFVAQRWGVWQVQLTMGEYQLSADGIDFLRDKLAALSKDTYQHEAIFSNKEGQTVVLADDLQYEHECTAGLNSCSITWDGRVIPCLSMRAWQPEDLQKLVEGDLLTESLQVIWETRFKQQRFGCTKCCRDCIKYNPVKPPLATTLTWVAPFDQDRSQPQPYPSVWPNTVAVYSVSTPPTGIYTKYGVASPRPRSTQAQAYAVSDAEATYVYGTFGSKSC